MGTNLKLWLFYAGMGIDIITVVVALYFVITDSINLTSSDNTGITIITIFAALWVVLSWFIHSKGNTGWAAVMAWIPAFPIFMYGLIILLFIVFRK